MTKPQTVKSDADQPPYSAASIANMFLNKGFLERKPISPMQIQKLIYLAHGYHLYWHDEPLVDEVFQAWKFGPVLRSVFLECREFSPSEIRDFIADHTMSYEHGGFLAAGTPAPLPDNEEIEELVTFVWANYKDYAATVLSQWTHEEIGPWYTVTQGGKRILMNQEVPNELIRRYFEQKLDR